MREGSLGKKLVNAPYLLWAAVFIVAPLLMVVYYTFTDASGTFTLDNLAQLWGYRDIFVISLLYSLAATVICFLLAYPLCYIMMKMKGNTQKMVLLLVMLPMWMNLLIRTYSWMNILETNGLINSALAAIGLPKLELIGTPAAVILGMVYNYIPYMILPIYTAMAKIDPSLLEAAEDLGCNGWNRLRRVIFPLSLPGVVSGITMVFVPSISTFYISQKLGNGKIVLIGDVIEKQFKTYYNYQLGAAISFVLMLFIIISLLVVNRFADGADGGVMI